VAVVEVLVLVTAFQGPLVLGAARFGRHGMRTCVQAAGVLVVVGLREATLSQPVVVVVVVVFLQVVSVCIESGHAVRTCGWVVGGLCVVAMWLLLFGGTLTPRVAGRLLIIICCGFFVVLCELESYF